MSALRSLRWVALAEGVSYALLLFIAVPLKHALGIPEPVRVLGSVHGVLVLAFAVALLRVVLEHRWPARRWARAAALSLVPLGAILLDRELRDELRRLKQDGASQTLES